ncbi:MAG TPA: glucose-1-phosphate adenylyltransferase [Armatimonadota bacterium]|jgi:glucose-1-phosphate adenylyltransferase
MELDTRRVYALVLGGGAGKRLFPLTKDRAKPAVPLAGKYRLIDVPVSNCINSRINNIFVLTQVNSQSLHRHIHVAYKFDIFSSGYVDILAAEQSQGSLEWYQGTADAVRRNLWHLNDPMIDRVLILSGDQIYRMDFREVMRTHDQHRADVTLAVTVKRPEEAEGLGVLKIDRDFRVIDFVEKPSPEIIPSLTIDGASLAPMGVQATGPVVLASMGIYLFNRELLDVALDNTMTDFGKEVIPWCMRNMRVYAHPFSGYWQDVGTIQNYFQANLDLAGSRPQFDFYDADHPIFTHPRFLPNSRVDESELTGTIVSEGCQITRAQIVNSIIGIRSTIGEGGTLREVIMLGQDNYERPEQCKACAGLPARGIGRDCRIERTIIDKNARIGAGVTIHSHLGKPDEDGDCYYVRDGIVIIPKNGVVPEGKEI